MKQFSNPNHFKGHAQFLPCSEGYLIFIHIPKAAGSTIERCLSSFARRSLSGHTPWTEFDRQLPTTRRKLCFAIVRNPYTRAKSAFKYLQAQRNDRWHRPYWNALGNPTNFEEFCEGLLKLHQTGEIDYVATHVVPQHIFLSSEEGTLKVDHVLKMESLQTDMKQMLSVLPEGFLTEGQKQKLQSATGRKINQSGSSSVVHTERTKEIIRKVYARDFELFYDDL